MSYRPNPKDTSDVEIPKALADLLEQLAKHNHDVWSQRRIAEGWKFGEGRDETRKLHPGLVEYEKLSETEKNYDRAAAIETIRLILSLGFRISEG